MIGYSPTNHGINRSFDKAGRITGKREKKYQGDQQMRSSHFVCACGLTKIKRLLSLTEKHFLLKYFFTVNE